MGVDVPAMKRIAATLNAEHPAWVIEFGAYSRQFIAFPKLFDGPPWVTAMDSVTLAALMDRAETKARGDADPR